MARNVNTGHFKLFVQIIYAVDFSGEDSLQIMRTDLQCEVIYFPSYGVYLSPALGATEKRLFIVTTEPRQERHGLPSGTLFTLWHVLHYLSLVSDTHTQSYSPNQSPLIGEIAFKGRMKKKKYFTVFILWQKIKLSQTSGQHCVCVFPLTLHQKVVRCDPITMAD